MARSAVLRRAYPVKRSVRVVSVLFGCEASPTALHAVAEVHDTLSSALVVPFGLGLDWTVHVVPFQCSANVDSLLATLKEPPTALQSVVEVHETPLRRLNAPRPGVD